MLIRPLSQSDSEAVRELDHKILGPDRSATWDTYLDRFLAIVEMDALPFPPWGCFVAEENGSLIGFLFAERQSTVYGLPPGARIVAIAVHPDNRHDDVGTGLVNSLIAQCENEGIEQIFAALLAADRRDARFLRSLGFDGAAVRVFVRQVGVDGSNGTGEDAGEKRAYDAIVTRVADQLKRTQDRSGEALNTALGRASELTNAAGEFTSEQIERASGYVRRDLFSLSENRERASVLVRDRLRPSRVKDGFLALASEVIERAGSGLSRLSDRIEKPLQFDTGEVTGPGTLTCTTCDSQMRFRNTGRIPPCPRCHATSFKKSY